MERENGTGWYILLSTQKPFLKFVANVLRVQQEIMPSMQINKNK